MIDTSISIDGNAQQEIKDELPMNSQYLVEVSVENADSGSGTTSHSYEWGSVENQLHVIINDRIVFAKQVH
ncbi:hypothetical protein C455_08572 [Haloferax larsenii JCM 13917]|nr:hypothetical protein C455_08572 [Haloferax larsenii JCM 13917]